LVEPDRPGRTPDAPPAAFSQPGQTELKRLSIEELMNLDVTRRFRDANAVNGVINIVARHTRDTQGARLAAARNHG